MSSSSSTPHTGLDEGRLLVALNAARDEVAARDRARGPVVTFISAARARCSVQTSSDAASESARMRSVIGDNDYHAAQGANRQAKVWR